MLRLAAEQPDGLDRAVSSPLRPAKIHPKCPREGNVVPNDTILETEDLTKDFAGFVAVRGVSLRVARGSIPVSYTHLTLPTTPYV